jgi:(1->4)-alpha-D-glucan 1-alpha-D-glucosylmutase
VRARINVLAEVPHLWRKAVNSWSRSNRRFHREVDGLPAPSRNDEYLFYQSLVGVWPSQPPTAAQQAELIARLQQYMEKATREAKERTSWISPNAAYDEAVRQFVSATLEPRRDNKFLADFQAFHESVLDAGLYNALSQVVLKLASPGVPDVYQGQEAWDFSLVDPDNRRPVDYAARQRLLATFQATLAGGGQSQRELARRLARMPRDPGLKLFGTWRLLQLRRAQTELFTSGDYLPLEVDGPAAHHACAFAWRSKPPGDTSVLVIAPRFCLSLLVPPQERTGPALWQADAWRETHVTLGAAAGGIWRDIFTDRTFELRDSVPLADLLDDFPAAVLVS